jgi:hypothetical protein
MVMLDDFEGPLMFLLVLAQLALPVVGADAILSAYLDMGFLSGVLRDFAYLGGAVGILDTLYWVVTDRVPALVDMY